ncbi:NAD-binding protein [Caldibacillus lycopersici]|uniref:NAD-binding protein n=1 Tax=Perspicuibacillus lycopersici TaxID=1325689 RepID=A0AAE3LPW6_9BACI|nr:potassium channel protein [Perspicuibacillus lycopersici]MCU9612759.1 NAD-binding protein [Perspicuibacillus lycopersici]
MRVFFFKYFERYPYLIRLLFIVIGILLFFGMIIHFIEPKQFPTIFDGIWWAIITTSTIGYGDFVPKTIIGRLVGILLVLVGVGFVTSYFVTLATMTVKKENSIRKGTKEVNVTDHIVIIGWNERSKEIITSYLQLKSDLPIVLIDYSLQESPFSAEKNIFFIKGNAFSDDILKKANIKNAELVVVTADATKNEIDADMYTILTIVAIKGFAPKVYCVAEILTEEQIVNAKRAGANEIIPSNKLASSIMLQTMVTHGVSNALLDFMSLLKGVKVRFLQNPSFTNHTFESVSIILLKENKVLLGVNRDGKTHIGPPPSWIILATDQLLIIDH